MFSLIKELLRKGVVGINRRNAHYVLKHNPRRLYPMVDDKLRTKELAIAYGLAVPDLYSVVEAESQVKTLPPALEERSEFVIKPSRGSGGKGILVIDSSAKGRFRKADGVIISKDEISYHVFNILSGLYSLGGQPDKAFVEYRVRSDPIFEPISHQGVPDIRIIVFLGIPVMAMVRLPTKQSGGKANLHQGAIGVGIDMATGRTLTAVWQNTIVDEHPDTGNPLAGVIVPRWDDLLALAGACYLLSGLGYLGVDIVLDKDKGPLILELNARPGLNIQIANKGGLRHRLDAAERHYRDFSDVAGRVEFAKANFAAADV